MGFADGLADGVVDGAEDGEELGPAVGLGVGGNDVVGAAVGLWLNSPSVAFAQNSR